MNRINYGDIYPVGDAGRLWKRALELGQGWALIGDKKVKIKMVGEINYPYCGSSSEYCRNCLYNGDECNRVYVIRLYDHKAHYGKYQCTKCGVMAKWASKQEMESYEY